MNGTRRGSAGRTRRNVRWEVRRSGIDTFYCGVIVVAAVVLVVVVLIDVVLVAVVVVVADNSGSGERNGEGTSRNHFIGDGGRRRKTMRDIQERRW